LCERRRGGRRGAREGAERAQQAGLVVKTKLDFFFCKKNVTLCHPGLWVCVYYVTSATTSRDFGFWSQVFHDYVDIRKALRRCQPGARLSRRRSSPRFPSLLLQCRQDSWVSLTPGMGVGVDFCVAIMFGKPVSRGPVQLFITKVETN
jgi:hypothetical protein